MADRTDQDRPERSLLSRVGEVAKAYSAMCGKEVLVTVKTVDGTELAEYSYNVNALRDYQRQMENGGIAS